MRGGGGHEARSFVGGHGAGGAPEDVALAVDEQDDDLLLVGDLQVGEEFFSIDPEGHNPVPGLGIGCVAAHRRGLPPAEDEVLFFGDGELVITELKIGVLQRLSGRHPGIDVLMLLGAEREQEQVGRAFHAGGERDFLLIEVVAGNGGEDGRLLLRSGSGEQQEK